MYGLITRDGRLLSTLCAEHLDFWCLLHRALVINYDYPPELWSSPAFVEMSFSASVARMSVAS